ncbi:MAG: amidohydrolase family protein [Candidatus Obscuribacterales bacterium]|nr:amidohydrolase family protein [Candidatus Obscuribacterales bacterium]
MAHPAQLDVIDFHTHLMSLAGIEKVFPHTRQSQFFKHMVPIVEPIADLTEGIHDQICRHVAMHFNDKISRLIYSHCGELFLMEALRLFKRHGFDRLIHSMDKLGIKRAVIHSLEPLTTTQEIIDQTAEFRERFFVFGSVAHAEPDPVGYLLPFVQSKAISGIKIHPMVGGYHSDDLYEDTKEFVALASDFGLPVAIHTGDIPIERITDQEACSELSVIAPLIRDFPKCKFILMHMGWESWRKAIGIAKKYPNVYLETSWQPARIIRRAVDNVGSERILFGSDFPLFQQWQALAEVRRALTEREFEQVAFKNAEQLLGLAWTNEDAKSAPPREHAV